MTIVLIGLNKAIAELLGKGVKGRAAATVTTQTSAPVVITALRAAAPSRTGALRNSIGVVDSSEDATSSSVTVGARVKYDLFYQKGTSRQPARPYSPQVAEVVDTAVAQIARRAFGTAVG